MGEEKKESIPAPPAKPPKVSMVVLRRLEGHFWDWLGIKSAGEDVRDQTLTVEKKGRVVSTLIVISILSIIGGCWVRGVHDESEIRTSDNLARSNAIVAVTYKAQVETSDRHAFTLQGELTALRLEKNAEIAILTGEKNSLQQRMAQLESMPQSAFIIYSNVVAMTNFINDLGLQRAILGLKINEQIVTNVDITWGAVVQSQPILIPKTRMISLQVFNPSKPIATRVHIDFNAQIDPTNLTTSGWSPQPPTAAGNHWSILAQDSIGQRGSFIANPLIVSTNFQDQFLTAMLFVHADNSITYEFFVRFFFQQ